MTTTKMNTNEFVRCEGMFAESLKQKHSSNEMPANILEILKTRSLSWKNVGVTYPLFLPVLVCQDVKDLIHQLFARKPIQFTGKWKHSVKDTRVVNHKL